MAVSPRRLPPLHGAPDLAPALGAAQDKLGPPLDPAPDLGAAQDKPGPPLDPDLALGVAQDKLDPVGATKDEPDLEAPQSKPEPEPVQTVPPQTVPRQGTLPARIAPAELAQPADSGLAHSFTAPTKKLHAPGLIALTRARVANARGDDNEAVSVRRIPLASSGRQVTNGRRRKWGRRLRPLTEVICKGSVQGRFWAIVALCAALAAAQWGLWEAGLQGGDWRCGSAPQASAACSCSAAQERRLWAAYALGDAWRLPLALVLLLRCVLDTPRHEQPELDRNASANAVRVVPTMLALHKRPARPTGVAGAFAALWAAEAAAQLLAPGANLGWAVGIAVVFARAWTKRGVEGARLAMPIGALLVFAFAAVLLTRWVVDEAPEAIGADAALLCFPAYVKFLEIAYMRLMRLAVYHATVADEAWSSKYASVVARMGVALLEGMRAGTLLAAVADSDDALHGPFVGSLFVGAVLDILSRNNVFGIARHRLLGMTLEVSDFRCVLYGSKVDTEYVPLAAVLLAATAVPWMPEPQALGCDGQVVRALAPSLAHIAMIVLFDVGADAASYVVHRFVLRVHPSWDSLKHVFPREQSLLFATFVALVGLARTGLLLGVQLHSSSDDD